MKRNRIWLIGLSFLTATLLIFVGYSPATETLSAQQSPLGVPVQAQEALPSPSPTPEASPTATEASPSPVESPSPSPTPAVSPSPEASPSPTPEESPSPEPTPAESPTPAVEAESEPALAPLLALKNEPYQNPSLGYEVGVVEGYTSSSTAGVPLIESPAVPVPGSESPDGKTPAIVLPPGSIAYTVAVRPRANDSTLNEAALTQVAIDTFARGEGFTVGDRVATLGGVKIAWQGSLTQGRKSQPVQGAILSRQVKGKLLLLLVAGTTNKADNKMVSSFLKTQIESVFETVAGSLEPLEQ